MNRDILDEKLSALPLFIYDLIDPRDLEFSPRIRYICQHDCPMYGSSWACPPAVGPLEQCQASCLRYGNCLLISTVTEVSDLSNIQECLDTRFGHEDLTNQVRDILRDLGEDPWVLSTESCAACERCAYLDGLPCRLPERMHPCVESQGINIMPTLERLGIEFQYGGNIVTWVSLLLF